MNMQSNHQIILTVEGSAGVSVGIPVGSSVGKGAMVGDPGGRAGQNVGHAFEVSACWVIWDMGSHRCERAQISTGLS